MCCRIPLTSSDTWGMFVSIATGLSVLPAWRGCTHSGDGMFWWWCSSGNKLSQARYIGHMHEKLMPCDATPKTDSTSLGWISLILEESSIIKTPSTGTPALTCGSCCPWWTVCSCRWASGKATGFISLAISAAEGRTAVACWIMDWLTGALRSRLEMPIFTKQRDSTSMVSRFAGS